MKIKCRNLFCAVIAALLTVSVSAAFDKVNTYTEGKFSDVAGNEWYAPEIKTAYELGLMNGTGETQFSPAGSVTVAEAVTMAARINAAYLGKEILEAGTDNWYDKYVVYAAANGILTEGQFDDFARPAKRYEAAELFAKALPAEYYTKINNVEDIPDVPASRTYKESLLTLYRAGVVMGSDSYGFFYPENNITRAEAAAIINRVAVPENRLTKKLDILSKDDSFYLCTNVGLSSEIVGIGSGWLLDNRGGTPRTSAFDSYSTTNDISETAGTALVREFNKTSTGNITLYTEITVLNSDGFYMEFRNTSDKPVYRVEVSDGAWVITEKDGKNTAAYKITDGETLFKITVTVDLDNGRSTTMINGKPCGAADLLTQGEETNILNFRYATTDESTASYRPTALSIASNYTLDEDFSRTAKGTVPAGWISTGGAGAWGDLPKEHLSVPGGASASYSFAPVPGVPVAEFHVLQPEKETVSFTLKSGSKTVAEFTTDSNKFYVNGETVYENYYKNLWYRVRLEADTDTNTVLVKINGRKMATVAFKEAATSVDNFTLENHSETTVSFDNITVMRLVEHEDYVPVPVVPKGAEDYYIGMNVCSLWRNGGHYGWSCITSFDDPMPVLGYYDEGVPETADWEIKYLVEHGIDFQAFCLFFYHDGPFNIDATHLFDGFMNAKYADMSEFCILLEATNGDSPASVEDWKERWVPYIIENFIKHESYAVKNNRPVFSVFGTGDLSKRLGSYENVKVCFDYLEEEVIKLGFDGMIYLGCGSSSAALQSMGFDGCHAYNWSYTGFDPNHNINSIVTSGDTSYVYTVPTVSVGFNHVPWGGKRYPLMTKEDYRTAQEWVRDEYLPAFAEQPWQENFVWLSTWNEYGEGTYIMPASDEKGFGYIDVIREVFTEETADAALNAVPTDAQRYRINHLYPQYRRILRSEGYYEDTPDEKNSEVLLTVNAVDIPAANLWSMKNIVKDENGVTAEGSNGDPIFSVNKFDNELNTDDVTHIKLTARIPKSSFFQIYYATGENTSVSESRMTSGISTTDELTEYYFSVDTLKSWGGKLNYLRLDPVATANTEFTVKSVEFIRDNGRLSKDMNVDGKTFALKYAPMKAENGEILVAFDPTVALDYRLSIFHEWDKENGVLELHFENCDIVYTVGSDKYTLNGEEKSLGFTLGTLDGLPLVPIEKLCKDAGYKYSMNENKEIVVETKLKAYYDSIAAARVPGKWEFDVAGDTEKWTSGLMTILVNSGYMACDSRNDTWTLTDPTIVNSGFERFSADDKVALELRVRYSFEPNKNEQVIKMYFRTDVNTGLSEKNSISVPLEVTDTKGEWVVIRMPLPETFKGNVTYLRLDPFDAFGHIDIDYIRFLTAEEAGQTEE